MISLQVVLVVFLLKLLTVECFVVNLKSLRLKQVRVPSTLKMATIDETPSEYDLPESIQSATKFGIGLVKQALVVFYGDRHYARFAALETIARVPYFSYTSVLHLFETFGWFRKKEYIQLHFAESWNELHHLLIMESLGGNQLFLDRFIAQHIAFFYYWIVVFLYMTNPAIAYDLNKHVETHAYETYDKFLKEHGEELKKQPAPQCAIDYYQKGDPYLFNAFQVPKLLDDREKAKAELRVPKIENLYDVFYHIREDEADHANAMRILQRESTARERSNSQL
jgi:ubiquinol oxidase